MQKVFIVNFNWHTFVFNEFIEKCESLCYLFFMRKVYLDNAATTPVFEDVISLISETMRTNFGNPSSSHQYGRTAKSLIETSRRNIAKCLNVSSSEILFTSGGTEANNLILHNAVVNLGVTQIITSALEHHAVLKTVNELEKNHPIQVRLVATNAFGAIDVVNLRKLLGDTDQKTLVSLMFVNNEIGSILNIKKIAVVCKEYKALFHSDAVQAIGHFNVDLKDINIDFISAAAHKFHGPKGIGFAFFKKGFGVKAMLFGGEQEKGSRAGTEAVHAIAGMDKALQICLDNLDTDIRHIARIKKQCIRLIQKELPDVEFNAGSDNLKESTVTILSVRLPLDLPLLLFNLDLKGIAISGGSACQSGSQKGSHVLQSLLTQEQAALTSLRLSFSKFTSEKDIVYFVETLKKLVSEKY